MSFNDIIEDLDNLIGYSSQMEYDGIKHLLIKLKNKVMSYSSKVAVNPASKFIEFKSDNKAFEYWDKEEKKNKQLPLPLRFIVLDELATITGYNDDNRCGFYSNEVHSTAKEPLTVRTFKGNDSWDGLYSDIKGDVKAAGGKFAKSMYCMLVDDYDLVNIKLQGAALSEWMDAKIDTRRNVICVGAEFKEGHKGKTVYNIPIFTTETVPDNVNKMAVEQDEILQQYFKDKASPEGNTPKVEDESQE